MHRSLWLLAGLLRAPALPAGVPGGGSGPRAIFVPIENPLAPPPGDQHV